MNPDQKFFHYWLKKRGVTSPHGMFGIVDIANELSKYLNEDFLCDNKGDAKQYLKHKKERFCDTQAWVYFIGCDGHKFVKIGMTTDINSRFSQLQTATPHKMRIFRTIPTKSPEQEEKEIHNKFAKYRHRGEWFKIEGELKEYLGLS